MKMKTLVHIAAAFAAALGCATAAAECEFVRDTHVAVRDSKYIVVSQEPIVVCRSNQWIYWTLDSNQPYRFTPNGIVINDTDKEFTNCKPGAPGQQEWDGRAFRCHVINNRHGEPKPRYYKYRINVEIPKKAGSGLSIDPQIMND